ncbi:MAG: TetR/AcrR family transcriptional regulator [Bacteroidetes bacterium]|nr:TetR/AcrR family transcriptional regulator [Bacteroidota bacterium]MDA1344158.1 TetR/AcrR family transcriptional regulator [Bacteroidota bacterium]
MKEKILERAVQDFLSYGFKNVTMDDLAQKLGISKKTIYEYFDNKNQLVFEASHAIFDTVMADITNIYKQETNPIQGLFEIKKIALKFLIDDQRSPQYQLQKYYPKIYSELKEKELTVLGSQFKKSLEKGIKTGLFRSEIDTDFVTRLYFNGIRGIRDISLFPVKKYKIEKLLIQYFEYHFRAIATPKGLELFQSYNAKETV